MTPPIENVSTWLVDWSLVTIIDNTLPPRDPNDDDNEDDEDDENDGPAVIREPEPDEYRTTASTFAPRVKALRGTDQLPSRLPPKPEQDSTAAVTGPLSLATLGCTSLDSRCVAWAWRRS